MNNTRAQLYLLKQYGFSDSILEYIFESNYQPIDVIFGNDSFINLQVEQHYTKKDNELAKDYHLFELFARNVKNKNDFLDDENVKLYFKYDKNAIDKLLPRDKQPLFFYAKGNIDLIEQDFKRVSIIGTRKPNDDFIKKGRKAIKNYVNKGFVTVSGLAEGIDTLTHEVTLELTGKTIAVLPTNFIEIYPKKNIKLVQDISEKGLLLSAMGPYEHTYKSGFLERNTYVAAMCDELLVVQTNLKSGTMNTLRKASALGKKIYYLDQLNDEINGKIIEYNGEEME